MKKQENLIRFLNNRGIELFGTNEKGLIYSDALDAIILAKNESIPVYGGDVYIRDKKKIKPAYANWYCDSGTGENYEQYCKRSCIEAEKYIRNYVKNTSENILFVLVLPIRDIF